MLLVLVGSRWRSDVEGGSVWNRSFSRVRR